MNIFEYQDKIIDFLEKSTKETFKLPVKEITEQEAENSAEESWREEDEDLPPEEPLTEERESND